MITMQNPSRYDGGREVFMNVLTERLREARARKTGKGNVEEVIDAVITTEETNLLAIDFFRYVKLDNEAIHYGCVPVSCRS